MSWPPKHLRLVATASAKPKRRNNQPEASLQELMVDFLDIALPQPSPDYWWSATMNGVRLTSERARGKAKR